MILKPGTLCWLTKCQPEDMGKVVEIINLEPMVHLGHEVYKVKCQTMFRAKAIDKQSGETLRSGFAHEALVSRPNLIPFSDPNQETNDEKSREIDVNSGN